MAKTTPDVINLKSRGEFWVEDAIASAVITPGQVVQLDSAGPEDSVSLNSSVAGAAYLALHVTDLGKGIDDDYAVGDSVKYIKALSGDEFYSFVPAGAAAIAKGALLEFDGAGNFKILASGPAKAVALEAVDNSGGGAKARIKVSVI